MLAAQRNGAKVALQADISLAAEQAVALAGLARVDVKAAFQHEEALQVVAEVLHATNAPARTGKAAGRHACDRAAAVRTLDVALKANAGIGNAVERYAGRSLGESGTGHGASCGGGQCEESFVHGHLGFLFERVVSCCRRRGIAEKQRNAIPRCDRCILRQLCDRNE